MITETANFIRIKYHLKFATNPVAEALASQGMVVDKLVYCNFYGHRAACFTERKQRGGDKGFNISSITEARLGAAIRATMYYEDGGCPFEPDVTEWIWIKHIKYLIQIQY